MGGSVADSVAGSVTGSVGGLLVGGLFVGGSVDGSEGGSVGTVTVGWDPSSVVGSGRFGAKKTRHNQFDSYLEWIHPLEITNLYST